MASLLTQPILFYLQILGLLIASVCVPVISGGGVVEAREQREFDYFVLALQWPGTFCRRTHHCCSSNGCCRGYFSSIPHFLYPINFIFVLGSYICILIFLCS
ncbi:hypothetical protein CsSME_00041375 [Camellia sinensis var. sinensis]